MEQEGFLASCFWLSCFFFWCLICVWCLHGCGHSCMSQPCDALVCMWHGATGWHWVFPPWLPSTLCTEAGSPVELPNSANPDILSQVLSVRITGCRYTYLAFIWVLGIQSPVLRLHWTRFETASHSVVQAGLEPAIFLPQVPECWGLQAQVWHLACV